jgi:uncharacterized membrane protein YccC
MNWIARRRRELRLSVRVALAGLGSFLIAQALNLPQGYWAVFAAVIVTETSVGGSVSAAVTWMVGTFGGALYGAAVSAFLPHDSASMMALELVIGLAPLAFLAAIYPRFRVAPATAIIVLATVNSSAMGPLQSGIDRVLEIGLGSIVGLLVSLFVLPSRAHSLVAEATNNVLVHMARLLSALTDVLGQENPNARREGRNIDGWSSAPDKVQAIHQDILDALAHLDHVAAEARQERRTRLTDQPDPGPLPRTLHRVRSDLVIIGRSAPDPLPEALLARLKPQFAQVSAQIVRFLEDCGVALTNSSKPPPLDAVEAALDTYAAEMEALRAAEMIRSQATGVASRVFAIGFAFQQMRGNLRDLADRVAERARR